MSQEFDKIEGIILQIKKESKIVKGGTKNKSRPSRELRNPDLYWKLGSAIKEILEQKNVDDEQKMSWVRKKILPIEEKILGPAKEEFTCEWSYKVVDELQNYEHFIYVANLAGHKFKKFR